MSRRAAVSCSAPRKCRAPRKLQRPERLEDRLLMTAAAAGDDPSRLLSYGSGCACPICTGQGLESILNAGSQYEQTATTGGGTTGPVGTPGVIPALSSNPGAAATLFLDFDGNVESQWGSYSNAVTPAYDRDGDRTTFSSTEIAAITEIWGRVAEDYAPFNINVTTVAPPTIANGVAVRIAIGGNWSDWFGSSAGGVAYINGFTNSAPNVGYVFEGALGNGNARYVAEATSHEAGHLFGLLHQASWNGSTLAQEYNQGTADWAPIMGVGYYSSRVTWHNGPTSNSPSNYQDDMAILANSTNGFGYRADDYGNTTAAASVLVVSGSNVNVAGLIGRNGDQDVFSFTTSGGSLSLSLNVGQYGPNLDSVLELLNAQGQAITTVNPTTSQGATLSQTLGSGTYYVVVRSSGGYGNVGQYTLTGTVPGVSQTPQIGVSLAGSSLADGGSVSFGSTYVGSAVTKTFTVTNTGSGTLTLTPIDAASLPAGYTLFANLGSTSLAAGQSTTFSIRLTAAAAGAFGGTISLANSTADGSFDLSLSATVSTVPPAVVRTIDNGASGFTTTGSWTRITGVGRESDMHYANKGNGSSVAIWTFTGLEAGTYRVSVTWRQSGSYATNAPFTVYNGTSAVGTVRVNERLAPSGLTINGSVWRNLGNFAITGNRLVVKLSNNADARVVADAVRIERIYIASPAALAGGSLPGNTAAAIAGWTSGRDFSAPALPTSSHVAPATNLHAPSLPSSSTAWSHDAVLGGGNDFAPELAALREARGLLEELSGHGLGSGELLTAIDELLGAV
ncbi:MAG: choice-of-anchor D domain-containing protein [Pirellulaceae bacterium]|nr:choice-of-anchor D domain-containing protein [Pirellulaceae bacterium]